ncbi:hypothetical protein EJC51_28350 [Streptomyces aquilus]|uniref:Lipoprotein n=1 Tax=Streptomyces aquilus TaxID=2548456 RepID=A0A3Q9C1P3_9ACTN|nr:hypothetical protein [Streptomyces aquilus]AZP19638.1 hypothetical protein EJC51_28350 [Streptomyces aquilus]
MKPHRLPFAAALAVTATLLLTACGNGDSGSSTPAQAAETPRKSATRAVDPSEPSKPSQDKPDGVDITLPEDINLVFDWTKPKDKNEAAAMDGAANFIRSIFRGVDKGTTGDAAVTTYATSGGLKYATTQINAYIDGGWTVTGTRRHYDATTRSTSNGESVEVAFCSDSTKFYGKETKTGKVLKTEPSIKDFSHFDVIMVKYPTGRDLWQAAKVHVETESARCR